MILSEFFSTYADMHAQRRAGRNFADLNDAQLELAVELDVEEMFWDYQEEHC